MGVTHSTLSVTIANGAALSGAVFFGEKLPCALQMPASWSAADITFQVSDDGTTWAELREDTGTAVSISSPTAAYRLNIGSADFASARYLKVRSGTSGAPVNQAAERTLTIITRKFYPVR